MLATCHAASDIIVYISVTCQKVLVRGAQIISRVIHRPSFHWLRLHHFGILLRINIKGGVKIGRIQFQSSLIKIWHWVTDTPGWTILLGDYTVLVASTPDKTHKRVTYM